MRPIIEEVTSSHTPESLVETMDSKEGIVLLRSGLIDSSSARYSYVCARPFLTFRSWGSRCQLTSPNSSGVQFGDPWRGLEMLMARYEMIDELDVPFPTGGCFGYWGYDLKNFVEPCLTKLAVNDLELPDCVVGFYSSVIVFDHHLGRRWIVSSGLGLDGSRNPRRARADLDYWRERFESAPRATREVEISSPEVSSNFSREEFLAGVRKAQEYIRLGHIYQVNLAQRLKVRSAVSGWEFFKKLFAASPAPYAAYLHCGAFEIVSSSPESFLRMNGSHIQTRPIKGTRPRSSDPIRDAQLTYELQTSPKEMAELVMITDLLRNDLGKICEYGSVQVPELVRLERYPQVQHLVSTVEGVLATGQTHFSAFASSFPGGSVTGAPKIRAMNIIDEIEPVTRGPYTGALGFLGFNRCSHLSIVIRTALVQGERLFFHAGAGIVADSVPEAEFAETMAKAAGFLRALDFPRIESFVREGIFEE
jgi:para-aminobenzoate synthetase component 1